MSRLCSAEEYTRIEDRKVKQNLKRNITLNYFNTFITNLNMQSAIWVLYLAYCNMNLMQVGILEGIYHATSIICEIPSGAMADLLGRKKSMILSRFCIAISCILMLFSRNFWLFALSFMIQALGNNFNSGSEEALIYDSMKCIGKEDGYMKVNGRMNMLIEVSQAIATVAGGILAEYSYFWCYAACTVIAFFSFVPVFFMTEPPITENAPKKDKKQTAVQAVIQHFKTSFHILAQDRRILKVVTFYSAVFASHTVLFFYSQQFFYDLGCNKIQISMICLVAGLASCMGAVLSEKVYKKLNEKMSFIIALGISIALIAYGGNHLIVAIIAFIIANFCNSMLYPVESESLNRLIPSEQRATLISVNSMFFSVVMIIIFPVVGALADFVGLDVMLGALGVVISIFIFSCGYASALEQN